MIRRGRGDAGVSSILGFIVGMVLLTGSLAAVVYFVGTAPETGTTDESRELESQAIRVVNTLATTTGQPANWTELRPVNGTELRSVGLLQEGSTIASLEKVGYLQNGTRIDAERLVESYNLKSAGYRLDAHGRVVPVPVMEPPESEVYAVGKTLNLYERSSGESVAVEGTITTETTEGVRLFENATGHFDSKVNHWTPDADDNKLTDTTGTTDGYDEHPEGLTGNTHPDFPWFVETQVIPQMAGIQATLTAVDETDNRPFQEASAKAIDEYQGGNKKVTRWHVFTEEEPFAIPGSPNASIKDHVLGVGYRGPGSPGAQGVGVWRSTDGHQSWALLGKIDSTGFDNATLRFDHVLRVENDEEEITETYGPACHTDSNATSCVRVRPSIAFWNTTAEQWTRLAAEPSCGTSGWNDTGGTEASHTWTRKNVDLCEALEHSTGRLWLALWWKTDCMDGVEGSRTEVTCGGTATDNVHRTWFVDNVEVIADGRQVFNTTFDPAPGDRRETLFLSNLVDHSRYDEAPLVAREHIVAYFRHFVREGGNVIAYRPGQAGDWFGEVGLEAIDHTGTQNTRTREPNDILMRMPYEISTDSDAYAAESTGWSLGQTTTPTNLNPDHSRTISPDPTPLDDVQNTAGGDVGTLMVGTPYKDGGRVSALAYDVLNFNDTDLRDRLLRNMYVSTIFSDPTFDASGADPPDSGTVPVQALKRVVLVHVTDDEQYQVPLEVTLYLWPQRLD